jgi:hypothetical protein
LARRTVLSNANAGLRGPRDSTPRIDNTILRQTNPKDPTNEALTSIDGTALAAPTDALTTSHVNLPVGVGKVEVGAWHFRRWHGEEC